MPLPSNLVDPLVATWRTNNRVTVFLLQNIPAELWSAKVPGASHRTVRMIGGHIHNARCMWIKMLGRRHGIAPPKSVTRQRVTRSQLIPALQRSSRGIIQLLQFGAARGGRLPSIPWLNIPPDIVHFLAYFVAHEGHHRGQIILVARQLRCRLPSGVTAGVWQWSQRAKEARGEADA